MSFIKFNPRTVLLLVFITAIAAVRVIINFDTQISPLANFSPVGAMALFGSAYFNKRWKAFSFPLLMLFLSDFILQQTVFKAYGNGILYGGWYWVTKAGNIKKVLNESMFFFACGHTNDLRYGFAE